MKDAYLVFENGKIFQGFSFGYEAETVGEAVFTTATTGYLEELTDPANYGKVLVHTFPEIGNCGRILADAQSDTVWAKAIVAREFCEKPSNYRMDGTLKEFLLDNQLPAIYGVDTRAITRMLRDYGEMNVQIVFDLKRAKDLAEIASFRVTDAVKCVSTKAIVEYPVDGALKKVALIDYGVKRALIKELNKKGISVVRYPYNVTADEILCAGFDGVVLSDGAGNAGEYTAQQEVVRNLYGKLPVFGIGFGHLLLAAALGGKIERMKFGHRGENQPVKIAGLRTFMTAQNHSYVVSELPKDATADMYNLNDGSIEGIAYQEKAFTVQYQPGGCGGPEDTAFLFDRFMEML